MEHLGFSFPSITNMSKKTLLNRALWRLLYYSPFWAGLDLGTYIREKYFWKNVKNLPFESFEIVLDAGCGPGYCAMKLAKSFPRINVIGCDIKNKINNKSYPANFKFMQKNLLFLDFHDTYDFVYSMDVLEHIPGNKLVMKNIYKALKPGGFFYLAMPNDNINGKRILPEHLFEDFQGWASEEHIGEVYTLPEIISIFNSIGFNVVESKWTFGFLGKLAWELDWVTHGKLWIKIPIMPFLKVFGIIDTYIPKSIGHILVIGQKPNN